MIQKIQKAISSRKIVWRQHALVRMMERDISRNEVFEAIGNGEIIEDYQNLKPFPGFLVMGESWQVPLHVVLAWDNDEEIAYIITVYILDSNHFQRNGKTRKERHIK